MWINNKSRIWIFFFLPVLLPKADPAKRLRPPMTSTSKAAAKLWSTLRLLVLIINQTQRKGKTNKKKHFDYYTIIIAIMMKERGEKNIQGAVGSGRWSNYKEKVGTTSEVLKGELRDVKSVKIFWADCPNMTSHSSSSSSLDLSLSLSLSLSLTSSGKRQCSR